MFKRRTPTSKISKAREFLWPSAGWRRATQYIWHRLHRLPGGHRNVAAGFACGAAASMTPTVGLHFIIAAVFAWAIRANVLASAIGTIVGNPWSFPFIWWATFELGDLLVGAPASADGETTDFYSLFHTLWIDLQSFEMGHLIENVWPIWWPMLVGSLPIAVVAWFLFYFLIRYGAARYTLMRRRKHAHRQQDGTTKDKEVATQVTTKEV